MSAGMDGIQQFQQQFKLQTLATLYQLALELMLKTSQ
jgi:hypothetical protein